MDGNYYLFTFLLHLSTHTHDAHAHAQAPAAHTDWSPPLTEGTHLGTVPRRCCHFPSLAPKTRRNTINTKILIFLPLQLFSFLPCSLPPPHRSSLFYIRHRIFLFVTTGPLLLLFSRLSRFSIGSRYIHSRRAPQGARAQALHRRVPCSRLFPRPRPTRPKKQPSYPFKSLPREGPLTALREKKPSLVLCERTPTADLA